MEWEEGPAKCSFLAESFKLVMAAHWVIFSDLLLKMLATTITITTLILTASFLLVAKIIGWPLVAWRTPLYKVNSGNEFPLPLSVLCYGRRGLAYLFLKRIRHRTRHYANDLDLNYSHSKYMFTLLKLSHTLRKFPWLPHYHHRHQM